MVILNGSGGEQTAGEDYTLTCMVVVTGGSGTVIFRWLRNGSPLSGQTSSTLSFSPLRQIDSGSYSCAITRSSITVRSASIAITVEGNNSCTVVSASELFT